jgi:hypothetical protein
VLRYLLHAHRGGAGKERADEVAKDFGERTRLLVEKTKVAHRQYEIRRAV